MKIKTFPENNKGNQNNVQNTNEFEQENVKNLNKQQIAVHSPSDENLLNEPIFEQMQLTQSYTILLENLTRFDFQSPHFLNENKILYDRFTRLKSRATNAILEKKIFTIHGYYKTIRRALVERGWVEKLSPKQFLAIKALPANVLLDRASQNNEYGTVLMSSFLEGVSANFVWQPKGLYFKINYYDTPYRNRLYRSRNLFDLTTKEGLKSCTDVAYWYTIDGVSEVLTSRCHRLSLPEERHDFLQDFRTTYCLSLVKFICDQYKAYSNELFSEFGTANISTVDFAINRLNSQINCEDMDEFITVSEFNLSKGLRMHNWETFYTLADKITKENQKIMATTQVANDIINTCKMLLEKYKKKCPNMDYDGYENLWIMKPGHSSQGHGIIIKRNFEEIMEFANSRSNYKYIVQKYIERPLLIYNTKFDIRQYSMVTITDDRINIWMYNDCYLKFSSHEYDLTNLHQSVHLTNHSVQKKYKNSFTRSPKLPQHNMWSLAQFQEYLSLNFNKNLWTDKISPGIKKNLIGIILSSLNDSNPILNSFEFYGCDFLLNESFEPILIEINGTPDMTRSTNITSKICPAALQDAVKVVIDWPKNYRASTGQFELIYSVFYNLPPIHERFVDLNLNGKKSIIYDQFKKSQSSNTINDNKKELLPSLKSIKTEIHSIKVVEIVQSNENKQENDKNVKTKRNNKIVVKDETIPSSDSKIIKKKLKKSNKRRVPSISENSDTKALLRSTLSKIKELDANKNKILNSFTKNLMNASKIVSLKLPRSFCATSGSGTFSSLMKETMLLNTSAPSRIF